MIKPELFGKDHWSTFAYIETRCVDHQGMLDRSQMRCHPNRHSGLRHSIDGSKYHTRLRGGVLARNHDDWDCADDLEAAGLVRIEGTGMHPIFRLTDQGRRVASLLRGHLADGGQYTTFDFQSDEKSHELQ